MYGRTEKRINGFEWSNQESVGKGVEPTMAKVELTMREIGDMGGTANLSGLVSLVCGGRGGVDDGRGGADDKSLRR